jgi:hypothetical protein
VESGDNLVRRLNNKVRHDKRKAKQKAKRRANKEEILPVRREDGTLDVTPHIAVLNMITKGKYLKVGRGFIIRRKIKEIKEVGV